MARASSTDEEILAQIPAARARARRDRLTRPHATAARYDRRSRVLHVTLENGGAFALPVSLVPELASASDADLAAVRVDGPGIGLHWAALDVDLSVAGLARAVLGARTLLSAAGAAGGSARTKAKGAAARENGAKGGRPRKTARDAKRGH